MKLSSLASLGKPEMQCHVYNIHLLSGLPASLSLAIQMKRLRFPHVIPHSPPFDTHTQVLNKWVSDHGEISNYTCQITLAHDSQLQCLVDQAGVINSLLCGTWQQLLLRGSHNWEFTYYSAMNLGQPGFVCNRKCQHLFLICTAIWSLPGSQQYFRLCVYVAKILKPPGTHPTYSGRSHRVV
jgi:hypothetical protein